MSGAIVPLNELTSRRNKRKFKRQALSVAAHLEEVNASFIWHLFNAPKHVTYNQLYTHYLDKWRAKVEWLAENKKFDTFAIDTLFFEREYKPEL